MRSIFLSSCLLLTSLSAEYPTQDYSQLLGTEGFSDDLLQMHFKLYAGYVKNTNELLEKLPEYRKAGAAHKAEYSELKRRFGWEYSGMRLHELYFENLSKRTQTLMPETELELLISGQFGSYEKWEADFIDTATARGIGWVVLALDNRTNQLFNVWIGEHDIGQLADSQILLAMDVWEHAYLHDYGLNRKAYISTFFKHINWDVVAARLSKSK